MTSLDDLHELVPAAEELDLLDEAAADAHARHVEQLLAQSQPADADERPGADAADSVEDESAMRPGQALGLVLHVLGGRVLGTLEL